MSKPWKESPVTVVFIIASILLVGLVVTGVMHGRNQRQYLVASVAHQIDSHSATIAALLSASHGSNSSQIEEAVYDELQRAPSTSLITRSMVSVHESPGSALECVLDVSSFGMEIRRIPEAKVGVANP
jgi:hypothetical protein